MSFLINGADYVAQHKNFELVGRENELNKLMSILVRKKSNSVLVVGPSGVGASSVILGLQNIKNDINAPFDIVSKRLFFLDTDGLFGLGDNKLIDENFTKCIDILEKTPNSVFIIEDAGDFYDSAKNSGLNHFINLINSKVKKQLFQVIFEINDKDFDKIIKWHSDFKEHYTMLDVQEPSKQDLDKIIEKSSVSLKNFHKIDISEESIHTVIELTQKYRVDGLDNSQPKRAINLLDMILTSFKIKQHKNPKMGKDKFEEIQSKIKTAYKNLREGEKYIIENEERLAEMLKVNETSGKTQQMGFSSLVSGTSYYTPEMTDLSNKIKLYKTEIIKYQKEFDTLSEIINEGICLEKNDVLAEFAEISGISVSKLGEDDMVVLKNIETNLKENVFGQDEALKKMSNQIKVSKIGKRNKNKPQGSFLLIGPSGTGKTEVVKQITKILKNDAKAMLRFDMSEYMEKHASAKLIGAPPGYEGFESGGILTNKMRENSNRIILFDEIEKAHPDVFNLFLQILDDGRLSDNVGRVVDFSESYIFMTSNIGQPHFLNADLTFEQASDMANVDLNETYRPEFLNRFNGRQNIICFNRLGVDTIIKIVSREFAEVAKAYANSGVVVKINDTDIERFCVEKYDVKTGARGLPGFINTQLEPLIADFVLEGRNGDIVFEYIDGYFRIKQE